MSTYDHTKAADQAAAVVQQKREAREASDRALEEFFARGGKVQTVANNVSGRVEGASYSAWGKPKKKAAVAEEDAVTELEVDEVDLESAASEDEPDAELE
jgi:hypothetical protein